MYYVLTYSTLKKNLNESNSWNIQHTLPHFVSSSIARCHVLICQLSSVTDLYLPVWKRLIDGMYRGESVTFLWGLLYQPARVVGLCRRPPVVFSRHIGIIQILKDGREVQKSKVEGSNNGNGHVSLGSLLLAWWPWDLELIAEVKEEVKRWGQHNRINPLQNNPEVVWAREHLHNKRADVNKKRGEGQIIFCKMIV